ncbi:hypothetical protein [Blattabacterium cuenoti]
MKQLQNPVENHDIKVREYLDFYTTKAYIDKVKIYKKIMEIKEN